MASTDDFLDHVIAAYTETLGGMECSDGRWAQAKVIAQKLASLMEVRPPATLLDLACGTGAETVAFALDGFETTGVDCTPAALSAARRLSSEKGVEVQWRCCDMRAIDDREEFDVVCLRDVVFSIFETEDEDRDLIHRISAALRTGGKCLFEVYDKAFALRNGIERRYHHDEHTNRFVLRDGAPDALAVRLYTRDEWDRMLRGAGLELVMTSGWNWKGDPEPPPWRANYFVAEKRR